MTGSTRTYSSSDSSSWSEEEVDSDEDNVDEVIDNDDIMDAEEDREMAGGRAPDEIVDTAEASELAETGGKKNEDVGGFGLGSGFARASMSPPLAPVATNE